MSIESILAARERAAQAEKEIADSLKSALNEELKKILSQPGVNSVAWSSKSSEYNDEGMYPGIHGPVINDNPSPEDEDDYWDSWVWGYGDAPSDPRVDQLRALLKAAGTEMLTDVFGDESQVVARLTPDGLVEFKSEWVSY